MCYMWFVFSKQHSILSCRYSFAPLKEGFFSSAPRPPQTLWMEARLPAMIAQVSARRNRRMATEMRVPGPAAQGRQEREVAMENRTANSRQIQSSSGGPCHFHPRPQKVAWMKEPLASLVMLHLPCTMILLILSLPEMSSKWSST
jgi:hypothetical protein